MQRLLRIVITLFFVPHFFISAYGYEVLKVKVREFKAYNDKVSKIFYSPNGKILYTCGTNRLSSEPLDTEVTIKSWDAKSGEFLETIHSGFLCDYSADAQQLLIHTSLEEGAILLDIPTKSVLNTFSHSYLLYNAMFSADGKYVYTCGAVLPEGQEGSNAVIKIWDRRTGDLLDTKIKEPIIINNEEAIMRFCGSVDVSPDEEYAYFSYGYWYEYSPGVEVVMGCAELVDLNNWHTLRILEGGGDSAFSPDKKHWALSGYNTRIFDLQQQMVVLSFGENIDLYGYSPNGKYILSGDGIETPGIQKRGVIWDASTGEAIAIVPMSGTGYSTAGTWSPDGIKVAIGDYNGTVTIWDPLNLIQSSIGQESEAYEEQ